MTKREIALLFVSIVLGVCLAVSVILGLTGFYSSVAYLNSPSDLVVGQTVSIPVKPNQASVLSFTFDGAYIPNENIPQVVQISATDLNADVRVRVKAQVFGLESDANFSFITPSHFTLQEDGYYYYDQILKGGNKITFCTHLITPLESHFYSGEKYVISIVVETLESKYDQNIWKMTN